MRTIGFKGSIVNTSKMPDCSANIVQFEYSPSTIFDEYDANMLQNPYGPSRKPLGCRCFLSSQHLDNERLCMNSGQNAYPKSRPQLPTRIFDRERITKKYFYLCLVCCITLLSGFVLISQTKYSSRFQLHQPKTLC